MRWRNLRVWLVEKLLKAELKIPTLTTEQSLGLLCMMYENDSFRNYLNYREEYLIKKGMENFLAGRLDSTRGLAGQLLEVRELRTRTRSAYAIISKRKSGEALKSEQKKPANS